MAMKCALCHKGSMIGLQHRHHKGVAGGRWLRRAQKTPKVFIPNLHSARILINGTIKRVRLCTKCLRRAKEAMKTHALSSTAYKVTLLESSSKPVTATA